ncbi:NADPH-dependent FMN reductase [Ligilactobacillus pobuzihii]|uniref:NADPH-dependent FMN reductase n=1 Tax=Ligilactobacillus pobuzihii TaxID=449659 RepID=A0A0R2LIQ5_9LACO|nr:NAD(P)H-dependent oxidoreductase [Ligilactobacillus pobuzihii]KRK09705.1 NADPH-dependent FMN reductase [Ligilactobacillus pobuzihii E100301 = KCTC 13174]KRO01668.1 NADPH-dependent FMN reductase [Ligilactobacillus pobuzihii]GEN48720.1 ACP phosphodiesterase [Ligilactobacillus pobuzihii]HIZ96009.1 NAD(P)H-dependent oxidoreductase [Candidatus Ligilactobacillus excrementavium]
MTKYGVIVGSIRKNSYSKGVAKAIAAGLPEGSEVNFLNIADLPLYSEDLDADSPAIYEQFRKDVKAQDAFIFVTPEHNRNIPAALKNALDVASRPWGQNVWAGKPALVASQSISGISGVLAHHSLRQSLVFLDMPTMQQPELYIGNTADLADDEGNITNEGTKEFLSGAGKSFSEFAAKFIG